MIHVSREAQKVESKLRSVTKRKEKALEHFHKRWEERRTAVILAAPEEVVAMLVAGKVIRPYELERQEALPGVFAEAAELSPAGVLAIGQNGQETATVTFAVVTSAPVEDRFPLESEDPEVTEEDPVETQAPFAEQIQDAGDKAVAAKRGKKGKK